MVSKKKRPALICLCICLFFAAAAFMLVGCGTTAGVDRREGTDGNGGAGDESLSYAQIGEKLTALGIGGVTEEIIAGLEKEDSQKPEGAGRSKTVRMLNALGRGEYDTVSGTWSLANNGVYSFDAEFSDYKKMYTIFLTGVSSIGEGELDFRRIEEDFSGVNWESDRGRRSVTFVWRGKEYAVESDYTGNRINYRALSKINDIIKAGDTGKRLYFGTDGAKIIFVFYRDSEWKARFEAETGLALTERISD